MSIRCPVCQKYTHTRSDVADAHAQGLTLDEYRRKLHPPKPKPEPKKREPAKQEELPWDR